MDYARLWPLVALGVGAVLFGLWPLWWMFCRAARRLFGRQQWPVGGAYYLLATLTALGLCAVGVLALSLVAMLRGWQTFTHKTQVAEIQAIELGPHKLRVYLVPFLADGTRGATEVYDVEGDEWEVGGDVLRWRPFMTGFGLEPVFRLTRVAGRWQRAADANQHKGSAFDRAPPSAAWLGLYRESDKPPLKWLVAGAHGQSVAQLPDRRAVYDLFVTANGYALTKRTL